MSSLDLSLSVDADIVTPTTVDLGVYLDNQLTMKKHISLLTRTCFFHLRRLRQIRHTVGREVTQRLISAVILSRLDYRYCNAVLAGLPDATVRALQRVQNSAARLVVGVSSHEHITPVLHQLHWLPVEYRIKYKLSVLMHHIHRRQCPYYLGDIVQLPATATSRPGLRPAESDMYKMPRMRTVFGVRAFSHAGPAVWNSLPASIQASTNTTSFCRLLKTFF